MFAVETAGLGKELHKLTSCRTIAGSVQATSCVLPNSE